MRPIDDQYVSIQSGLNQTRDEYNTISEMYKNLSLRCNAHFLYEVDAISKEELKSVWRMLQSPDKENHTVAEELIDNKFKILYNVKLDHGSEE